MKHLHFLGICGTFMAGLALLARQMGYDVTGSDENIYPPMNTLLHAQGVEIMQGFDPRQLELNPDLVIVGNVMKRGMPIIETLLNSRLSYTSGPQWLSDVLLRKKRVVVVAGTHGKTTTTSLLAWIMESAGLKPGFLVGGIPENFGVSARLGESDWFVIEGDEYDTGFFDKRSKFVHYHPEVMIFNNLEFDHADIFKDLAAIQTQFHHGVRVLKGSGLLVRQAESVALDEVLAKGIWTPVISVGLAQGDWQAVLQTSDGRYFSLYYRNEKVAEVQWPLLGRHNVENALAAIAVAYYAGVSVADIVKALQNFRSVKRRLQLRGEVHGVRVYDDFAHHPTAITHTLHAVKSTARGRVLAVLEPRSNTMRMNYHGVALCESLQVADYIMLYQPPGLDWQLDAIMQSSRVPVLILRDIEELVQRIQAIVQIGDEVVVMSNGSFDGIHEKLLLALS